MVPKHPPDAPCTYRHMIARQRNTGNDRVGYLRGPRATQG